MHWLFALARFYPYWALPLALVGFETGVYYKRRNRQRNRWICWGISGLLLVTMLTWFWYRGDLHSDHWVRSVLNQDG